ncbi:MAG: (d)CMP kinase [Parvibaculaceae bacterium]
MIVAVDGPAAAGKGTLARRLAKHFGMPYLDTGSLYRAVALTVMREGRSLEDADAAAGAAGRLDPSAIEPGALREAGVGEAASVVAAMPAVRQAILKFQRDFAARPEGAVLDGRDIGTVVCPEADVKLFVTASLEERAKRRRQELAVRGDRVGIEEVLETLRRRDARDTGRAIAPLRAAPDAHLLDTTDLDIEAAFRAAVAIIERHKGQGAPV